MISSSDLIRVQYENVYRCQFSRQKSSFRRLHPFDLKNTKLNDRLKCCTCHRTQNRHRVCCNRAGTLVANWPPSPIDPLWRAWRLHQRCFSTSAEKEILWIFLSISLTNAMFLFRGTLKRGKCIVNVCIDGISFFFRGLYLSQNTFTYTMRRFYTEDKGKGFISYCKSCRFYDLDNTLLNLTSKEKEKIIYFP